MEPQNILFVVAFIVFPIAIGIWALMTRRSLSRARTPTHRKAVAPPQPEEQPTMQVPQSSMRDAGEAPTTQAPAVNRDDSAATVQVPAVGEAESREAEATRPAPAFEEPHPGQSGTTMELPAVEEEPSERSGLTMDLPSVDTTDMPAAVIDRQEGRYDPRIPRPFFAPRYVGRSSGVVKRLSPRTHNSFLSGRGG